MKNRPNLKRYHQRARRKARSVREWWERSEHYGTPQYFERKMYEQLIDGQSPGVTSTVTTGRG